MNSKTVEWIGRCDGLRAEDLNDFDDSSREIGYKTFRKYIGRDIINELNKEFGVPLHKDYHVRFAIGKWKGQKAICLFHSAYHYIWTITFN